MVPLLETLALGLSFALPLVKSLEPMLKAQDLIEEMEQAGTAGCVRGA